MVFLVLELHLPILSADRDVGPANGVISAALKDQRVGIEFKDIEREN